MSSPNQAYGTTRAIRPAAQPTPSFPGSLNVPFGHPWNPLDCRAISWTKSGEGVRHAGSGALNLYIQTLLSCGQESGAHMPATKRPCPSPLVFGKHAPRDLMPQRRCRSSSVACLDRSPLVLVLSCHTGRPRSGVICVQRSERKQLRKELVCTLKMAVTY